MGGEVRPHARKQSAGAQTPGGQQLADGWSYIKVRGRWTYFCRAVDKQSRTVDFLLTTRRDLDAALRFLRRATEQNGAPEKVNIDKSGANAAGIAAYNADADAGIEIRQCRHLNNIVEQDHRLVKQRIRAALGLRTFQTAKATLTGVELVHMIRKGQVRPLTKATDAQQFYALAAA